MESFRAGRAGSPGQPLFECSPDAIAVVDAAGCVRRANAQLEAIFGYSSLGCLAQLPVHTLKIDRCFIMTMLNDPNAMTLVQTIISLAHSLELEIVAEGVETEEQAKMLRLLRCDEMQGYLISKPLPMEEITLLRPR